MKDSGIIWPWLRRRIIAVVMLCVAGCALSLVGQPAADWQRTHQPAFRSEELKGIVGQGVLLGMFGGLRSIMADMSWVRAYSYWEKRDRAGSESMMRLAIILDPGNIYFWINAANIIGYDQAHWEIAAREYGGRIKVQDSVKQTLYREYAENALKLLDDCIARFPDDSRAYIYAAQLTRNKLNNIPMEAEYYRRAAECKNRVWFAGRIYAMILGEDMGKPEEALEWYRDYYRRILADKRYENRPDLRQIFQENLEDLEERFSPVPVGDSKK
ncbi:MAG: hypothetical protein LBV12_01375 [Puniceicoccales bacterium]|jgi:hypothetical protein|nr:hypothetical protein [Puniceicoccales bacterium]